MIIKNIFAKYAGPPSEEFVNMEHNYRRGFVDGYEEALRNMWHLHKAKGFSRNREIRNILYAWLNCVLCPWSWSKRALSDAKDYKVNPPDMNSWCYGNPVFKHEHWLEIRKRIFKRDGRICAECGATEKLQITLAIDHIQTVHEGGLPIDENLRVLCEKCNLKKGSKSGVKK